jgi:hypothetical protein
MYIYGWIFSYYKRVRFLSYILFYYGVSNEIITQTIIIIGPYNL